MKIVQVVYTIPEAFAQQNQQNIQQVMATLKKAKHAGINYHACLGADGKTFTHTAFFRSDEDHKILNDLPEFLHFQQQLKANGFEAPPKQEMMTLIGASNDIFAS